MKSHILNLKVFKGRIIEKLHSKDLLKIFSDYYLNKENIVIVVAGTSRNMIIFGNKLRVEILIEYAFYINHNLCRSCSKNFNGMHIVLSFEFPNYYYDCSISWLASNFLLFLDTNLPGANKAMKATHSIIEFFSKSTQAMTKLRNF